MKSYEFLDNVLKEVKYRTRHAEIRAELRSHIEEQTGQYEKFGKEYAEDMAVGQMGDASELGKQINNQYRMPFNSTYGIAIWSFINTVLIYLFYPVWIYIWNRYPTKIIYAAIVPAVYVVLNLLYLKRGHFKFALRDWRDILIGTLAGVVVSIGGLLLVSSFFKFGYYPYGYKCEIPVKWDPMSFDMPMGIFAFWVLWMVYMMSLGKPGKEKYGVFFLPRRDLAYHTPYNLGDDNMHYFSEREEDYRPFDMFSWKKNK